MDVLLSAMMGPKLVGLQKDIHIKYLSFLLKSFPKEYCKYSHDQLTAVHFIVSGLDLLGATFSRSQVIDWVHSLKTPGGFVGGNLLFPAAAPPACHIADIYCGLCILKVCGDQGLSQADRSSFANLLRSYQSPDTAGCFRALPASVMEAEADLRFVYCACCISTLVGDWSGVDRERTIDYILSCQSYEGGFGMGQWTEAHSGLTYCAVASLKLLGALDRMRDRKEVADFLMGRYDGGWNGRIGKVDDSCYSFWNLGALAILGTRNRTIRVGFDPEKLFPEGYTLEFLWSCQKEKVRCWNETIGRICEVLILEAR